MIRIGREIQCLPYAGFLFKQLIYYNQQENHKKNFWTNSGIE